MVRATCSPSSAKTLGNRRLENKKSGRKYFPKQDRDDFTRKSLLPRRLRLAAGDLAYHVLNLAWGDAPCLAHPLLRRAFARFAMQGLGHRAGVARGDTQKRERRAVRRAAALFPIA